MAERPQRPLTKIPSFKEDPNKVFELYKEAGRIPAIFTSWEDIGQQFQQAVDAGLSDKKAREVLGLTHKSVAGTNVFGKTAVLDANKKPIPGKFTYVNPRAINEDIDPTTEMHIRRTDGDAAYNAFYDKLKKDWTVFSESERRDVQARTGKQFHRGHGWAASSRGGSVSQDNMYAEHGQRNVLHSSADRWPEEIMRDVGVPKNNLEAYYADRDRYRLRTSHAVAMDDDWTAMNPDGKGFHRRSGSINPQNAEILSDKLDQLEAQGLNREGIDKALMERSATLSKTNSVAQSGPVRSTKVDPRAIRSVNPTVPTKQQLEAASRAATIATKVYGVPAPKPVSKPPVGQQAKLNGKPVVWDGKTWKPVMPNRLRLGSNRRSAAPTPKTVERTNPLKPGSASQQIRRLQNSAQDALLIHPGMSLPSINLIRGI